MQINNSTKSNMNFTACIKLKGDDALFNHITNNVLKKLPKGKKQKELEVFMPDIIFYNKKIEYIDAEAERFGYSREWLLQNAKLHEINTDLHRSGDIYFISGDDLRRLRTTTSETSYQKDLSQTKALEFAMSKPAHLRFFAFIMKEMEHLENLFKEFIKGSQFKTANTLDDALNELLK